MSRAGAPLCGPTSALSSLQKHISVDRALQQDQIHPSQAGPSVSQGFRTVSAAQAAQLNYEFEQFSGVPQASHFPHSPPPSVAQQAFPGANWAAEFQRLTLTNTPPVFRHVSPRAQTWGSPAPATATASTTATSWHSEFLAQFSQPKMFHQPPALQQQYQQYQQHQQYQQAQFFESTPLRTHSPSTEYSSPSYYQEDPLYHFHDEPTYSHLLPATRSEREQQEATDAAFDLAFEEAQRWQLEATQHDELDAISQVEQPEEGKGKGVERQEDADELSRTAGQLLDSLAPNQSKKFQESNFLALMRKLRNKEVKVEGGEMVEVGGSS